MLNNKRFNASTNGLELLHSEGRWDFENDQEGFFCWTKTKFQIDLRNLDCSFMTIEVASPQEKIHISLQQKINKEIISLVAGWQKIDIDVRGLSWLVFKLNKAFTPENDPRQLGIMIRTIQPHDDKDRHRAIRSRHKNFVLNEKEYIEGVEKIKSFPPYLRVTLSKACNIAKEKPCVYCSWEWAKKIEYASPEFDSNFIEKMGRFVEYAIEITDCSYGEPTIEKEFYKLIDLFTYGDRRFEFTSNGQTLNRKIRQKLLGSNATIYTSIDSATSEGYNRYRNHRFDLLLDNLRSLCIEKKRCKNLPRLVVSYIVMRSNRSEIKNFLRLMKCIGVDSIIFRNLYREDKLKAKIIIHNRYIFNYDEEYMSYKELKKQSTICKKLGEELNITVRVEWDSFVQNHSGIITSKPLCSEPWKAAYILNRGIVPCCYGRSPFIKWDGVDQNDLENSLINALNSQPFKELRQDLASGSLGKYCLSTVGCPIVKKLKRDGF